MSNFVPEKTALRHRIRLYPHQGSADRPGSRPSGLRRVQLGNRHEGGYWTYHLEDVWSGLQTAYGQLAGQVEAACGEKLRRVGAMGFSAMMHGYLPLDKEGNQLCEFRTWRNTITEGGSGPADRAVRL